MGKGDRGLEIDLEVNPAPPADPPLGNYYRLILTYQTDLQPIKDLGFLVGIVVNDMATGIIPTNQYQALVAHPNVVRIDGARRMRYALDASRSEIKADLVHKPPPNSGVMGYDGTGVIIGVIDHGFDYRHRAFRKGDGTGQTRILRLWDQKATQWKPGLNYGKKYTEADINSSLEDFKNPGSGVRMEYNGDYYHGSHVSSIAAGSGIPGANGKEHVGIAPGADLILVESAGGDATIAEAIVYIAEEAKALGRRAVINMSLGSTGTACDGYSPNDRMMNSLAAEYPNLVLVAAAGNGGGYDFHVAGEVTAAQPFNIQLQSAGNDCVLYIWYPGTEAFLLTVTPPADSGQESSLVFDLSVGAVLMKSWTDGNRIEFASEVHPYNNKRRTIVTMRAGARDALAPGVWTLSVSGTPSINGKVHSWIDFDISANHRHRPRFVTGDGANTVESPGSADKVIAVGAYITTPLASRPDEPAGVLSFFSSKGPLLGPGFGAAGRMKPDLCAPGHMINSAETRFGQQPTDAVIDTYVKHPGTSMAAPHVAGVVALLLQKEPSLTAQQVYNRLIQNTRKDAYTGNSLPNPEWGYGKVDAWATLFPPAPPPGQNAGADSVVAEVYKDPLQDLGNTMARSTLGRDYLRFYQAHFQEVVSLIRDHKRVATAWLRSGAPAAHTLLTHLLTPDRPLPTQLYGRSLRMGLSRFLQSVARYGGQDLREAVNRLGEPLPADGLTWNQIRAHIQGRG